MKRVLIGFCLFSFFFSCGAQEKSPSQTQVTTRPQEIKPSEIVAKVGDIVVSKKELLERYQSSQSKEKLSVFLQKLLEEKAWLLEVRKQNFQQPQTQRKIYEKWLARKSVDLGFQRFFNAQKIPEVEFEKTYKMYGVYQRFYRPDMVRADHLLARFPYQTNVKDPKVREEEEKLKASKRKEALQWIQKSLLVLQKKNPQTEAEFSAACRELVKEANEPDPRLLAFFVAIKKEWPSEKSSLAKWKDWLTQQKKKILSLPYFGDCNRIADIFSKQEKTKKLPSALEKKAFLKNIETYATKVVERLRTEKLPFFPPKPTPYFGGMVDAFANEAFALKDKQMSSAPVETSFGYHIVFRVEKQKGIQVPFEKVKEVLRPLLYQKLVRPEYFKWVRQLFQKYNVKIEEEKLKALNEKKTKK